MSANDLVISLPYIERLPGVAPELLEELAAIESASIVQRDACLDLDQRRQTLEATVQELWTAEQIQAAMSVSL